MQFLGKLPAQRGQSLPGTDQAFLDIDVDCAKLPYMLRAYYAWKNGLPFSYVDGLSGEGGDLRYTKTANRATSRHDFTDHGNGINGPEAIRGLLATVYSGDLPHGRR